MYNKKHKESHAAKKGRNRMNILAISSSPRKNGNSDLLCDQFLKGAA